MFARKKTKKNEGREQLFKRETYIPKKKLNKKDRTIPLPGGRKRKNEEGQPGKSIFRSIVVIVLWLSFIGEVLYVLFFAGFFTITTLTLTREGEEAHLKEEALKEYIASAWQGNFFMIVPKNNLLLLYPAREERKLLQRFPKLAEAHVERHFPNSLEVRVVEKPYQLVWCRKQDCFLVNENGLTEDASIFFQYPEEQGKVMRIEDRAEAPVESGTQVLNKAERQFVHDLTTDFPLRTGLTIEGALERPSIQAKEIRLKTNKGFTIFFNTELPVQDSLNTLMLVLTKEIPENEWDKIDYIDLRTENRVYYTRKDRVPEKTEAQKKREEEQEQKRKEEEEQRKAEQR